MTFKVGVVSQFTASHHLVGDFGPASVPHAHAYRVEVGVVGDSLGDDGTLIDITRLEQALAEVVRDVDGANLNQLGLARNPTAEIVARFFFERLAAAMSGQGLTRLEARVWESPEAYASYSGDLT